MSQNRYYSSTASTSALSSSATNVATTLAVTTAAGFPVSTPFTVILERDTANEEVITVTAVSGTTLTAVRGADGTTAVAHSAGAVVEHGVSARDFNEPQVHMAASSAVHGLAGSVVGTTDSQTLTNKTLTTPTIGSFANAGHAHTAGAGGGVLVQANTHGSPDTDVATTSLHHTIGTGANQAAPGTHPAATATHGVTGALVGTTDAQTLTSKTLTAPVIATISNTGTLTLPTSTDTLVGRATTDTLTNKTLTSPTVNGATLDAASTIGGVSGTALASAWTTFTPTLTNVTTGTTVASYRKIGKTLLFRVHFTGGTATANADIAFSLPATLATAAAGTQIAPSNSSTAGAFTAAPGATALTSSGALLAGAAVTGIVVAGHIEVA